MSERTCPKGCGPLEPFAECDIGAGVQQFGPWGCPACHYVEHPREIPFDDYESDAAGEGEVSEWDMPSVLGFSYVEVRSMDVSELITAGLRSGDRLAAELANRLDLRVAEIELLKFNAKFGWVK